MRTWALWALLLCAWVVACATTDPIEAPPPAVDAGEDVRAEAAPDASAPDNHVTPPKPEAGAPETSAFQAPVPVITAMAPMKATAGGVGATLTISGDDFVSWSVVRADGADLATTFVSETQLRAQLPATRIEDAGVIQIDVFTSAPGGGKSTNIGFLVENPAPVLTSIAPTSVLVGSGDLILTLNGTNFAKNPRVSFDGVDLVLVSASATMITATVPSALMANAGSHNVYVSNPAPGGGKSSTIAFIVTNPSSVTVTTVSPTSTTVGSGDLGLSIDGTGFVTGAGGSGSVVSFNGTNIPSTVVDATHISATIPAALLTTSGSYSIVVTNPPPGGGVSNPVTFEVKNPAPSITSLSPNTAFYGGADRKISVLGTGFVPSSVVRAGGIAVTTTYVSANALDAIVPAAKLAQLGQLSIEVQTPAPGGGTSAAATLFVVCDPSGVDLGLGPVGNVSTMFTDFKTAPQIASLNSAVCPTTIATAMPPQPHRAWVVQNNQATPVTVGAWAVCTTSSTSEDDALMTIYKRPSVPVTNEDRLQCATVVSEGQNGAAGDYRSPEANGSIWCPGLTKANGGGVTLNACERAVVLIHPYSNTSQFYTPPVVVRIKAE